MVSVAVILERTNAGLPSACAYIRLVLPLTRTPISSRCDVQFVTLHDLSLREYDVVIAHRASLRTFAEVDEVVSYCHTRGARLIYDLDDDLLAIEPNHLEFDVYGRLEPVLREIALSADQLWVSTNCIADRYRSITDDIAVLENVLDHRVWRVQSPKAISDVTHFLYMGTRTHQSDFWSLVAPAFRRLHQDFGSKVKLDVIGILDFQTRGESSWTVVNVPARLASSYPAFATWLQSINRYSVGLAPLERTKFNVAKSDIKWLEYSAMGLGTIAAKLPPYSRSIEHEQTGLLVEPDADSFYEGMRCLVLNAELRFSLQEKARASACQRLGLERITDRRLERLWEASRRPQFREYRR